MKIKITFNLDTDIDTDIISILSDMSSVKRGRFIKEAIRDSWKQETTNEHIVALLNQVINDLSEIKATGIKVDPSQNQKPERVIVDSINFNIEEINNNLAGIGV